jgi:hypothetical protein
MNGVSREGDGGAGVGDRLVAKATRLSVPRYPGTEGDRKTIVRLERLLRAAGLETETQPFSYDLAPAIRALSTVLVAGGLLTVAAGLIAARSPLVAGLVLVSALIPGLLFLAWSPWLERLYRRSGPTRTANVIGTRPAADPRLTMIVMAHHDSKSQSLSLPVRMTLTAVAAATTVALAAACGVGILAGRVPGPAWLAPALGCTAGVAAVLLATMRSGNRSPGGVDNGGSLAILLELARTLPDLIHDRVELVVLATGAEEDHMVGAMRWLDAYAAGLVGRPVFCLNLDGAGAPGRVVLIERFGFGRRFSPVLSRVARQAARGLGIPVRGILMLPGLGIDAIPFAHRGIDCLTLASGSLGRATMSVHSARDLPEHLDPATLDRIFTLAQHIVLEVVQKARSENQ